MTIHDVKQWFKTEFYDNKNHKRDEFKGKTLEELVATFKSDKSVTDPSILLISIDDIKKAFCEQMLEHNLKILKKNSKDNKYVEKALRYLFTEENSYEIRTIYKDFYGKDIDDTKNDKYVLQAFAVELLLKNIRYTTYNKEILINKYLTDSRKISKIEPEINKIIEKGQKSDFSVGSGHNHLELEEGIPKKYLVISRYLELTMFEKYYYKSDMFDYTNILNGIDWAIFNKLDKECKEIIENNLKFINNENEQNAKQFVEGRYSTDKVIRHVKAYAFANYFLNYYIDHPNDGLLRENIDLKNETNMEHILKKLNNNEEKQEAFKEFCKFINMFLSISSNIELTKEEYSRIYYIFDLIYNNINTKEVNVELKNFNNWMAEKQITDDERYREHLSKIDPYVYDSKFEKKIEQVIEIFENEIKERHLTEKEEVDVFESDDLYLFYKNLIANKIEIPTNVRLKMLGKTDLVSELKQFSFLEKRIRDEIKVLCREKKLPDFILPDFIYNYPLINTLQLITIIKNSNNNIILEPWMYGNNKEFYCKLKENLDNSVNINNLKSYYLCCYSLNGFEEIYNSFQKIKFKVNENFEINFFRFAKEYGSFSIDELIETLNSYDLDFPMDIYIFMNLLQHRTYMKLFPGVESINNVMLEEYKMLSTLNYIHKQCGTIPKGCIEDMVISNNSNILFYSLGSEPDEEKVANKIVADLNLERTKENDIEIIYDLIDSFLMNIEFKNNLSLNGLRRYTFKTLLRAFDSGIDIKTRIEWFKSGFINKLYSGEQFLNILETNIENVKLKKILDLIQKGYFVWLDNQRKLNFLNNSNEQINSHVINLNNLDILHWYIVENNNNFTQEKLDFYLYDTNNISYDDVIKFDDETIIDNSSFGNKRK